jgi:glutamate formiminotransferase
VSGIVEAVPNLSEGERTDVIDRVADAAESAPGAWLLDRTSDADHARTVLTVAGDPAVVSTSMEAVVSAAIESIDLRRHRGVHPRIGAVDVVPFVPLAGSSMATAIDLARTFAARVARRHDLPVYLYAEAATTPARRILADIRRHGSVDLAAWMGTSSGRPDFGPSRPHPTAGATVVGARPVLIAWNIQLATADVTIARRIAARIRERDGGLPGVQALGFYLAAERVAQVSMNILDHARTPLWRIWERAAELAAKEDVALRDSELIGLMPRAALVAVADHLGIRGAEEQRLMDAATWLRLRDASPDRVLEVRLRQRIAAAPR